MASNYKKGLLAEWLTAFILMLKGYRIKAHRYKTKSGEIDLIAAKGKTIIFIEVKWRKDFETGKESVTKLSQNRIIKAAKHYIAGQDNAHIVDGYRFDVVVWRSIFHFSHIVNAFWDENISL